METVHSTSQFRWGHEETSGVRVVEPDPSTLVPYKDDEGNEAKHPDGSPVLVPPAGFQPEYEQVALDTVVVIDSNSADAVTVFKFAFDKEGLSRFLSYYVQFLDVEGRNDLRDTLSETSDVTTASLADIRKLELVK